LLIARDLGYLTTDNHGQVKELVATTIFDLNKIIKTLIS
jgi:hypothetical protein